LTEAGAGSGSRCERRAGTTGSGLFSGTEHSMDIACLYSQREDRIIKAVSLETPDRVPVVLEYAGFAAYVTDTPMAQFISSSEKAMRTMIEAHDMVGDGDAINYGSFHPFNLCYLFGAKVKVPGFDLPDNAMWQVLETELMTFEDYGRILDVGWSRFFEDFMRDRVLNDAPFELLPKPGSTDVRREWAAHGVPVLSGGTVTTPIELLWGSRSFAPFALDMVRMPGRVTTVMDAIVPHLAQPVIERARDQGYPAVWVGGWRSAPCMLSPEMWDRFVWPYFHRLVGEVVDSGLIALLHLDSNWDRALERFLELPRGRCIMATDGTTDIFRAKEVLGGHMCLMGDVAPGMLSQGSPDEVYSYCTKLIQELGPDGFILQSGCDIPTDAKLSSVQAMVRAATGG
jgi:hypothetical protein